MISKLRRLPMSIRRMGNFYLREFDYRRAACAVHRRQEIGTVWDRRIVAPDGARIGCIANQHLLDTGRLGRRAEFCGARRRSTGHLQGAADSRDANEYLYARITR